VTPFVLMLAATLAAREVIGDAATGDGVAQQFLMLVGSVAGGATAGAGYFAWYIRELLFGYVAMLRGRRAAPA
jgi:hypothetical protein